MIDINVAAFAPEHPPAFRDVWNYSIRMPFQILWFDQPWILSSFLSLHLHIIHGQLA